MIVGEVKEGHAELNAAARDPRVLRAALLRFGCCAADEVPGVVDRLLERGEARTRHDHLVRVFAFGSTVPNAPPGAWRTVSLGHIVAFLQDHVRDHWSVLRHAQVSDPVLRFLALLEKAERGTGSRHAPPEGDTHADA